MSEDEAAAHAPDAAEEHGSAEHGTGEHGGDDADGHGHEGEALGPIDVPAWGAGILGFAIAGLTALAFAISTGYL